MYTPKPTKGTVYFKSLIQVKDNLKEKQTKAEKLLWNEIRNRKLGYKFRRQHIINNFIVDFYCVEKLLAIEVDGDVHLNLNERDEERDSTLKSLNIKVIRFSNFDIENNIVDCLKIIKTSLNF